MSSYPRPTLHPRTRLWCTERRDGSNKTTKSASPGTPSPVSRARLVDGCFSMVRVDGIVLAAFAIG